MNPSWLTDINYQVLFYGTIVFARPVIISHSLFLSSITHLCDISLSCFFLCVCLFFPRSSLSSPSSSSYLALQKLILLFDLHAPCVCLKTTGFMLGFFEKRMASYPNWQADWHPYSLSPRTFGPMIPDSPRGKWCHQVRSFARSDRTDVGSLPACWITMYVVTLLLKALCYIHSHDFYVLKQIL